MYDFSKYYAFVLSAIYHCIFCIKFIKFTIKRCIITLSSILFSYRHRLNGHNVLWHGKWKRWKFEERALSTNHKLGGFYEWTRMYSRQLDYLSDSRFRVEVKCVAWSCRSLSSDNRDLFTFVSSATYKRYFHIHTSHFLHIRINHSRVIAMEKYTRRSFRFLGNTIIFRRQTLHG